MAFWNEKIETMDRRELESLQSERLRHTVQRVYERVPFYRRRLDEANVRPEDIHGIEDITRLPFTTKQDLRDTYPFGLFAVPLREVIRVHASSGTSGKPTVVGYTRGDIEHWAELMARNFAMVGVSSEDVFQNAANYGLFTGGLGIHYGIERIGATAVPSGTGNTIRQLELMRDFGVTVLHCTPSYALYLSEVASEMGIIDELRLRIGCFGAEPWSSSTRRELEDALHCKAYDSYGLSEMYGPGVAFECTEQDGLHIWEDYFFVEVIDPKTGEQVAEGEKGELVLTSLRKEAMPLIRYRTGDITRLLEDECACGRTMRRISRVLGRADDMLIVRGINVFPSQIEEVLMNIKEIGDQYQVIVDRKRHQLDEIVVRVELNEHSFTGEITDLQRLREYVEHRLRDMLNLRTRVELVEKGTIERTAGKAKRILDLRKLDGDWQ
ncbi:phenylacetate--CoA ligase family protein [Methermicoccus shengliensis]|uniref:Phenylacetate--CoA ligase n=1 Tax=Methermicoccus shengliensis TaxID=660064 RepID=A0A832RXN2_9EURY|nr:phenylacetate--CoA ligase [Methermicoccus shengliensis]HIH70224.1 phenylacetate--CoA ligase [Methermicoccus shengliensis]